MRKICYHGYYGFRNSGDDAFAEVCAWGGKQFWNTSDNVFLTGDLPILMNPAGSIKAYNIRRLNRISAARQVVDADCLVSAGGSLFLKYTRFSLLDTMRRVKNLANRHLRSGAIGVSVGPFQDKKAESGVVDYLRSLDFLALRDNRSYRYALSLDLPYEPVRAFDLAALLPDVYAASGIVLAEAVKTSRRKVIGISVCRYESRVCGCDIRKEEKRNQYLMELISRIPSTPDVVLRFFVFNGHPVTGDEELTDTFIRRLWGKYNIEKVPYLGHVYKTWKSVSECDVVISTRLHAGIFACYAKVPFFQVEYHQKCADFLTDVGQPERYRLYDAEKSVEEAANEIRRILWEDAYTPPVYRAQTIELARNNFLLCNP